MPFELPHGLKPPPVLVLVPLPQEASVNEDGVAFVEYIRPIHEFRDAIKVSNELYAL